MIRFPFPTAVAAVLVTGILVLTQEASALGEYKLEYATINNGSAITTSALYQVSTRIKGEGTHSTIQESISYSVVPVESSTAAPSSISMWSLY